MTSHWHNPAAETQNSGNTLGSRPCVRLSESYMKQFSGLAAAEFTGGSPVERIPAQARHNPYCPDFSSPRADNEQTQVLPPATPPRNPRVRKLKPESWSGTSGAPWQSKQAFWSGRDISNLIYGGEEAGPSNRCEVVDQQKAPRVQEEDGHRPTSSLQAWSSELKSSVLQDAAHCSNPTHEVAEQELDPMEHCLERWAYKMGLIPEPLLSERGGMHGACAVDGLSSRCFFPYNQPLEDEHDYITDWDKEEQGNELAQYDINDGSAKQSYHQRLQSRRKSHFKNKIGNGDIITWSQTG